MPNPSTALRPLDPGCEAPIRLADLGRGEEVSIVDVAATGPVRERLLDLGFVPGTAIALVQRAPLGDPCVYALRGVQVCLRREEAARILVQRPCQPEPTRDPGRPTTRKVARSATAAGS